MAYITVIRLRKDIFHSQLIELQASGLLFGREIVQYIH
jgi:hypothetical protein